MTVDPRPPRPPSARPAAVTAVLGWIVPGLGHLFVGRPGKALLYFVIVVGTYGLGLRLAEFLCVHPDRERYWFVGQVLAGGPTALVLHLTQGLTITHRVPFYELGLLYTTAAGLLNAVAVADALGVADERRRARDDFFAWRRSEERAIAVASAARADASLALDPFPPPPPAPGGSA